MSQIPSLTREALDRYRFHRIKPGGFLCAVLTNDLAKAVRLADSDNTRAFREIVYYCIEEMPVMAWGSQSRVDKWLKACPECSANESEVHAHHCSRGGR